MPNIELRECPFCGGGGKIMHNNYGSSTYSYVKCEKCKCATDEIKSAPEYCSDEKAAEAWNRRNDDAAEKP